MGCGLTDLPGRIRGLCRLRPESRMFSQRRREDFRREISTNGTWPGTRLRAALVARAPFEGILLLAVLEHVPEPSRRCSRGSRRSSPPSGRLVATTPHPFGRWPLEAGAALGLLSSPRPRRARDAPRPRGARRGGAWRGSCARRLPEVPSRHEPARGLLPVNGAPPPGPPRRGRDHGRERAHAQPPGRDVRVSGRRAHGRDGPLRLGEVLPRVRHALRRGPAPLRRVDVDVRPAVPRAARAPGRRRDHPRPSRDRDRAEGDPRARPARPSGRRRRSTTSSGCSSRRPARCAAPTTAASCGARRRRPSGRRSSRSSARARASS